ncbi:MAG TPA: 3-oxoacyl-ACP synthase, partial [Bacteroidia bacterium]|nr:3-oxoacyl-ACP synthase [Bacteroidia bacterium]
MTKIRAAITAVNAWVPENVMTNKDMEKFIDTTDEWIQSRTGIKERHILNTPGEGTSDIGARAVEGLLKKRGIT